MPPEALALAYPWGSLDRLSRSSARRWGTIERHLNSKGTAERLVVALRNWLGEAVRIEHHGFRAMQTEPDGPEARLRFRLAAGNGEIVACFDTRLVTRLVGFALDRKVSLSNPLLDVDPTLLGALAAIVAKILDDANLNLDLSFATSPLEIPYADRVQLDTTLVIGDSAYPLVLGFVLKWIPRSTINRPLRIAALGTLELELPIVIGEALMARDDLALLGPGRALVTGSGLWIDAAKTGHGVLIAPRSERGVEVRLLPDGKIVLGESAVTINHDGPPSTTESTQTLADTLFEAPVIVRVEMGTVSLPAKDWAEVRPGDILETGQPLGSDVTLRVAGKAVAKGELLNIEGELGVRITKLLVGDETQ